MTRCLVQRLTSQMKATGKVVTPAYRCELDTAGPESLSPIAWDYELDGAALAEHVRVTQQEFQNSGHEIEIIAARIIEQLSGQIKLSWPEPAAPIPIP